MNNILVEFKSNEKKYISLYKTLKDMIVNGKLDKDTKLPSKRELSSNLMVSINTIMNAYNLLLEEGYIYAKEKSGYFVSNNNYYLKKENEVILDNKIIYNYDFTTEHIDVSLFPYYTIRKLTQNIMLDKLDIWMKKSPSQGDISLRKTIASYLYENKGMEVTYNNIIIVSSLEESLSILSNLISIDKIGLENPTYPKIYNYFKDKDITLFAVDNNGIILDKNKNLDLICVTPYHQFPSGYRMSSSRKKELLEYPSKYILEDDFDCDLIYGNKIMSTLYSYNNERVIYHGSFSHTICSGIRLSYLVLPSSLINIYLDKYKSNSSRISSLDQLLVNEFLLKGYYNRHLFHIKKSLKRKKEIIRNYLDNLKLDYEETSLNFLVSLNDDQTKIIINNINKYLINIRFIKDFLINKSSDKLIIAYHSINEEKIIEGLDKLFENINK